MQQRSERPVSVTCMQWILLQEGNASRRCGPRWWCASFQPPFPSPEPGSNLVKDLPRAQTGQANLLLSPPCSLHSLARPESNPAPSLPLLLFRCAHVGVGARAPRVGLPSYRRPITPHSSHRLHSRGLSSGRPGTRGCRMTRLSSSMMLDGACSRGQASLALVKS